MSLYACLLATRNKLRTTLNLPPDSICITDRDGRPPAIGWNTYVAVHGTRFGPDEADLNLGLSELYDFSVTISQRVNGVPPDKTAEDFYVSENLSTERLHRRIILDVHQQYDILTAADEIIGDSVTDKMIEPFRWRGGDPVPQYRGPEWLKTWEPAHLAGSYDLQDCFITLRIDFGGAKRVQATSDSSRTVS